MLGSFRRKIDGKNVDIALIQNGARGPYVGTEKN